MENVPRPVQQTSSDLFSGGNGRGNKPKTVHIATNRLIGEYCQFVCPYPQTTKEECDIFISVLSTELVKEDYLKSRPCFNFHPGILPQYRGSGCSTWAIINGEAEGGATLHEIDKGIDTGPIIDIERFPITEHDTAETVFHKTELAIVRLFDRHIDALVSGTYTTMPQEGGRAYYRKDLERAKDLTKFVRAFTFEGKEGCFYIKNGKKIYLWKFFITSQLTLCLTTLKGI